MAFLRERKEPKENRKEWMSVPLLPSLHGLRTREDLLLCRRGSRIIRDDYSCRMTLLLVECY